MDEKLRIKVEKLKEHTPTLMGMDCCHRSAVCIPLIETEDGYEVLFEVRSTAIDRQPGDICFPGGMMEPGETSEEAAVREMMEELLVSREQIRVLGLMDVLYTGSLLVYPYAVLLRDYRGTFSTDEVAEVFTVPLQHFLDTEPERYYTRVRVVPEEDFPVERIYGGEKYQWRRRREEIYFYHYDKYEIWGLTAKMVKCFAGILNALQQV